MSKRKPKQLAAIPAVPLPRDERRKSLIALEKLEGSLLDAEAIALGAMWASMNAGDIAAACELAVLRLDVEAAWLAVYKLVCSRLPPPPV